MLLPGTWKGRRDGNNIRRNIFRSPKPALDMGHAEQSSSQQTKHFHCIHTSCHC